jgi:hypothetical protein
MRMRFAAVLASTVGALVLSSVAPRDARAQESEYDPGGGRIYMPPPVTPRQVGLVDTLDGDAPARPAASPSTRPSTPPPGPASDAPSAPDPSPPAGYPPVPAPPLSGAPPPAPRGDLPPPPGTGGDLEGPRYPASARRAASAAALDAAEEEGVRIPSRIATRLRALDRDFTALSLRGSTSVTDGILAVVTGALSIGLGVLFQDSSREMATYLYIYGGGSVGRGLAQLLLSPNLSDPALVFAHMPMTTVDEVKERLRFGERELESLADRSRLARILDGSLNILTGAAFVPFYLAPRDFAVGEVLDFFVIIAAAVSIVSGIATLATQTDAERRWNAYDDLRTRLRRDRRRPRTSAAPAASRPAFRAGATTLPGGGAVTVGGTF